ncbi:tRNA (adenosine(37)-N6)-threonylcarbamoyltransferase complex ATPase subunit type 1 TsaE [Candidatus Peregrinibacteria bacterium]|nr:tRNA (adenosine(37)-N6)-threonylcarbamoyltransferase complex ATPase subunit type 1 TsaE [Candidatus Peregrinibacteria bacterium]
MKAIYHTKSQKETIGLGERLGRFLKGGDNILLFGELGSGKTHFVKGIAKGLGVDKIIKSPTFAYVNRYPVTAGTLYHYDLYRLSVGDDVSSLGLFETLEDPKAINVIEWADRIADLPEQHIRVDFEAGESEHAIAIEFFDPETAPESVVEKFYKHWSTPLHVREHCEMVAKMAMEVADKLIGRGEIVNLNLLYPAAMLHDLCRLCDFYELERGHFKEKVTEAKWKKWNGQWNKFRGQAHDDIASDFLIKQGYPKTAEVVRLHKSNLIVEEARGYDSWEKKILFYADKRVLHNRVVSLAERFEDGRERHGKFNDEKTKRLFQEVEKRTFELEKELGYRFCVIPA